MADAEVRVNEAGDILYLRFLCTEMKVQKHKEKPSIGVIVPY